MLRDEHGANVVKDAAAKLDCALDILRENRAVEPIGWSTATPSIRSTA